MATYNGTSGKDNHTGTALADTIFGQGDNDVLRGEGGADVIDGGEGDDQLFGGTDNDKLYGQTGADLLDGGDGDDFLDGGIGSNVLRGGAGNDELRVYATAADVNTVDGGVGDDLVTVSGGTYRQLRGGDGTDRLHLGSITIEAFDARNGFEQLVHSGTMFGTANANVLDASSLQSTALIGGVELRGLAGNDTLIGTAQSDKLYGGTERDTIRGGDGRDFLYGEDGADTLSGEAGDDVIDGGAGNDRMFGGDGIDTIGGGIGDDVLDGGDGNDVLADYSGTNVFRGGAGDDTIRTGVTDVAQVIDGGTGNDVVALNGGIYTSLQGGKGIDTLDIHVATMTAFSAANGFEKFKGSFFIGGTDAANALDFSGLAADASRGDSGVSIDGKGGNDTIRGTALRDTIAGGDGDDTLFGMGGNDVITGGAGKDVIRGGDGDDRITDTQENATLFGEAGNDIINTAGADDTIDGGDGNDTIDAATGLNIVNGGAGDDIIKSGGNGERLNGGLGNDVITISGHQSMKAELLGGKGVDTLVIAGNVRFKTLSAAANEFEKISLNASFSGTDGDDAIDLSGFEVIGVNAANFTAGLGNDRIIGSTAGDSLYGSEGDDIIEGGLGNDRIDGGRGYVDGKYVTGHDLASYEHAAAAVRVSLADGRAQDTVGAGIDLLVSIEGLIGSAFGDTLTGDGFANELRGLAGDDRLEGGTGDDLLLGGDGVDVIEGDSANSLTGGNDTLRGGLGNDFLYDGGGTNLLFGEGGDDTIATRGGGTSTLDGGNGNDTLQSAGRDTILGGSGNDRIILATGAVTGVLDGGAGIDTLVIAGKAQVAALSAADTAIEQIEFLAALEGTTGGDAIDLSGFTVTKGVSQVLAGQGADSIRGSEGDDWLYGGAGADVIEGGAGDDHLSGSPTYNPDGSRVPGGDVVSYEHAAGGITISLLRISEQDTGGAGVDTLEGFDGVIGSAFADDLEGNFNANIINGAAGDDQIDAMGGDDLVDGGEGNDTINASVGRDIVRGGRGSDVVYGDLGADTIEGGEENDVLWGGLGRDILDGGAGDDIIYAGGLASTDDPVYYHYAIQNPDNAGAETLRGGAGADTYVWRYSMDLGVHFVTDSEGRSQWAKDVGVTANVEFNPAEGDLLDFANTGLKFRGRGTFDGSVKGGIFYELTANGTLLHFDVDGDGFANASIQLDRNVVLRETAPGSGILAGSPAFLGTEGVDALTGTAGNDLILALGGDDVLEGGAGDDELDGGAGSDTVSYANAAAGVTAALWGQGTANNTVGAGIDTLRNVENLRGSAFNDNLLGDDNANRIEGGAGDDTIQAGKGGDVLVGGAGADLYILQRGTMGFDGKLLLIDEADRIRLVGFDNLEFVGQNQFTGSIFSRGPSQVRYAMQDGKTYVQIDGNGDGIPEEVFTIEHEKKLEFVDGHLRMMEFQNIFRAGAETDVFYGGDFKDKAYGDDARDVLGGRGGDDILYGEAGNDTLEGGDGVDTLIGGDDSDYLDGGSGADIMIGGRGSDGYEVDDAADQVLEYANQPGDTTESYDQVYASINYSLPDHVETLYLLDGAVSGWGNNSANTLIGNDARNILEGRGGADTLFGYGGSDDFVYRSSGDVDGDSINDFTAGDKIDLRAIDARANLDGDQSFAFLGDGAFTGAQGQLRLAGGNATDGFRYALDLNGDKVADATFTVHAATALQAGDFML